MIDACGKCGGDNASCAGCDGIPDSGTVIDKCGNCKSPSDVTFNQGVLSSMCFCGIFFAEFSLWCLIGCGSVFYISRVFPLVLALNSEKDKTYVIIDGYFNTHQEVSCFFRHDATDTVVNIGPQKVKKAISRSSTDAGKLLFSW